MTEADSYGRRAALQGPPGEWQICPPNEVGLTQVIMDAIEPRISAWTAANVHTIVMCRYGKLAYEHYFCGEDECWGIPVGLVKYDAHLKHDLRSITKSIVSLLFGIAIDQGWVEHLDLPVIAALPDYASANATDLRRVTLRHLLSMTAGFEWNESLPYGDATNSERKMTDAPDRCRYVLSQPITRPPGSAYVYNGGLTTVLAGVLVSASGRPLDVLANEMLFEPLGISDVEWIRYADGTPNAASGLRMRARDLAKIGQMVLNGGRWGRKPIVSQSWITQSTSAQIEAGGSLCYGLHWWTGQSLVDRKDVRWIAAIGYGGQRMFIVPSLDLLVIVLAGMYSNRELSTAVGETILGDYVLRATVK
ncbi:MAG TPA: serine hydrolase [Trinickia sp.]|uniref:serine hydrolase domain-containing protein n=1 Tax=Trinickia sp. TaxID=2571163 RepID=UPI002F4160B1